MGAPIVYRWDDGNAPVARGERTSLIEILTACLVTGYGEKPAAGWTLEYTDGFGTKAAFRNNPVTGTGFYLLVDGLAHVGAQVAHIQGYEMMTDIDNGTNPFPAGLTTNSVTLSNAAGTTSRPWLVIADDRAFYLFVWASASSATPPAYNNYSYVTFFGDIISRYDADGFACAIAATGANCLSPQPANVTAFNAVYLARLQTGAGGALTANHHFGGGPMAPNQYGSSATSDFMPVVAGEPVYLSRPFVSNGPIYTFRGFLPGLYQTPQNLRTVFDVISQDGMELLLLNSIAYNTSYYVFWAIDVGSGFRP